MKLTSIQIYFSVIKHEEEVNKNIKERTFTNITKKTHYEDLKQIKS